MKPIFSKKLQRRTILAGGIAAGLAAMVRLQAAGGPGEAYDPHELLPPAPGGVCRTPSNDAEEALLALADTIVPGGASDPQGAPGARETCALSVVLSPAFPVAGLADVIQLLLNGTASSQFGKDFVECTLEQRTLVADIAEEQLPLLTVLYRAVRAAFYGASYNEVGTRWMGFPGENLGYIDHPDFTMGVPVSKELTKNGHLS